MASNKSRVSKFVNSLFQIDSAIIKVLRDIENICVLRGNYLQDGWHIDRRISTKHLPILWNLPTRQIQQSFKWYSELTPKKPRFNGEGKNVQTGTIDLS